MPSTVAIIAVITIATMPATKPDTSSGSKVSVEIDQSVHYSQQKHILIVYPIRIEYWSIQYYL